MPKGLNLGNIFKDKTIGATPMGVPTVVTRSQKGDPSTTAYYVDKANEAKTSSQREAIVNELQSNLAAGLITEEDAIIVLRNPELGGMNYRSASGLVSDWTRAAGSDAFRGFGDQLPDSMMEGMGAAGTASPGAGSYGWDDWSQGSQFFDWQENLRDPATQRRMRDIEADRQAAGGPRDFDVLREAERQAALAERQAALERGSKLKDEFIAGADASAIQAEINRAEAERKALLEGQARQEASVWKTDAADTDMLITGDDAEPVGGVDAIPDPDTAAAGVKTASANVAAAKTPEQKKAAEASLKKAKSIEVKSKKVASDRAKQAKETGIRDENDLKNRIANDPDFSSKDAETWLINNRGLTSSQAARWVQDRRLENAGRAPQQPADSPPAGSPPAGSPPAGSPPAGGFGSGAQNRQMIQMESPGALPTPIQSGIGLEQAMATPGEAFQQYRLSQYGGQPSAAELARAQRTGALYTGFQPSYGRFLLSATRPTSDIELGAFGDEQAEGEAFARFLRSGQRAPIGDVRSAYGGLADYLTQISQGGMPGGESGLRYGAVFGQDLGPQQIKGNLLETTMASLGMAPGMGGRTYRNLANIYATMQAQYGQEAGAANFANWVSGGLGNQSSPNAFNSFNPTQSTYTPAQQTAIRKMRPTSSDIINRQAIANQMTGGYIGGGWSPTVDEDTYGGLEDVMVTGGGF